MSWASEELRTVDLGDALLNRRLMTTVEQRAEHPAHSVPQACGSAGSAKAVYRLWYNERVSNEAILEGHVQATCRRCLDRPVVLAIQDTTDLDFTGHPAPQGLGYLERSHLRGSRCTRFWRPAKAGCRRVSCLSGCGCATMPNWARNTRGTPRPPRTKKASVGRCLGGDPGGLTEGSLPLHGG